MNEPQIEIRTLPGPADPIADELVLLYESAFPLQFRDDVTDFTNSISGGHRHIAIAIDRANGDTLAGFYSIKGDSPEAADPFLYLPYFAVHSHYRGRRLVGPLLWESLIDVAERRQVRAILLEVENEADDPEFSHKRIRFYMHQSRWPARLLLGEYRFFQRIAGRPDAPQMYLMVAAPTPDMQPEEAYALCASCFGDAIVRTGESVTLHDSI